MTDEMRILHGRITYFEMIGSWGMAEQLRKILKRMIEESTKSN